MNDAKVLNALMEADRLVALGRSLKTVAVCGVTFVVCGKEAAAFKRASLDLTRALAEMRKS